MKLALVRQGYTPFGGSERLLEYAIEAIQARGASVTIISRNWPAAAGQEVLICDPFYVGSLLRDRGFAAGVRHLVQTHDFDLVQAHERIVGCDIFHAGDGVHAEWLRQRRRIMGFGGRARLALNPYHAYMKATERKMFQSARLRAVICVSKMVKQEIRDRFGVADDKLHVIYNGVDTGRFNLELASLYRSRVRAELRWPESDVVLLLVGSGFERKGVGVTIEALRELPSHVRLLVVGKDKRLEHYRAYAQRLGLGSRVEFTGGQKDVLPYYGAADIFVMPSVYEPFGNVVLEAFASGLPVVTSTKCGAGELIEDNREGSVVDALDVRGLAAALLALTDIARRQAAGKAARRKAEVCTWNSMAASFNDLYRELLAPVAQSAPQPAQR